MEPNLFMFTVRLKMRLKNFQWNFTMKFFDEIFRWNFSMKFSDEIFRWNFSMEFFDEIFRWNFSMKFFDEIFRNFGPFPVIQPLHSQLLEASKDGNSRSRSISGVSMRPIVSPGSRFWIWQVVNRLYWLILPSYNL